MKIWIHLASFLAFFLSYFTAQAQKQKPVTIPERLDNTLLWEIKGKGLKKNCYLYGTIHLIDAKEFFLTDQAKQCFKKTKALFTEIDMSNLFAMSAKMLSLAPMKDTTLRQLLGEDDYLLVKNYFEKECKSTEARTMPFTMYENWQPILLQAFLYQDMIGGPTKSYEMEFIALANEQNKSFGGLETVEDQMQALGSMPYSLQAKGLLETIKSLKEDPKKAGETFQKMVAAYKSQDIEGMVAMVQEDEQTGSGEEALLTNRNKNWIPRIIAQCKKQPTFFAVGAAHLGGPNGVIRLLMAEGYTLTPVKP